LPSGDRAQVLIIKLGAMGDVVQAVGAYRDIRDHHPDAMITILTGPLYKELIERCPWIDRVWSDPRAPRWRLDKMMRLRAKLRAGRFHRVYDLQNSDRTASYYRWFLSGVPWSGTAPGCSHPHKHPAPKRLPGLERMAGQLADAGLAVNHTLEPDLTWAAADVSRKLRQAGIATSYVALIPGSSARHPDKRWPHYGKLAERLIAAGHEVVVLGGPEEIDLIDLMPGKALLGGRDLSLPQYAGVLRGAAFVVGNDTGPCHLAAHLWAPGLALFGGYYPSSLTSLRSKNFQCLEVERLAELPVETVYDEVTKRLPPLTD
jgi:ADP-heptose:LPS heptosyltransferase